MSEIGRGVAFIIGAFAMATMMYLAYWALRRLWK